MSYETIQVNDADGVRTITLNRPDAMNSVNSAMTKELAKELKGIARDASVRCLVITGAGKAFCVGQDLKEAIGGDRPMDFAARLRAGYNPVVEALTSLRVPTIASINGAAAGAGWSLALACDYRICASRVKFVSAFSNIGLVPDSGMTWTLPRLVGYAKALEIAWMSEPITAESAQQMGLVNRVVEDDNLAAETTALAEKLAKRPTKGLVLTRQAMMAGMTNNKSAQLEYEAMLQSIAGRTKDYDEGVKAFIEKRQPEFAGE
ncbi:MAG: enoyl-CoA hydratase/isomerase family protein [Phycisphaerales bacterium]|nr:enoyl-CoA hydratase/isomerase family protein [Phycisphaerales bacterium]MCB9862408.1 enoyl-CoA hydratase/isomerase family protein [Phycisphaerales bacterium]